MLILDPQLGINPTRSSVARYRKFQPMSSSWEIQDTPIKDQGKVESNKRQIDSFFQHHLAKREVIGGTAHTFIRQCPTRDVIELIRRVDTTGTDWDSAYVTEYLERLFMQGVLPNLSIAQMSSGEWRERGIEDNGRINQLMQGKNKNYPGDREIHNGEVLLQCHYIQCQVKKVNVSKTTAFALHIPQRPEFNLSFVVRGEE
jgi:hypothetical protein